MQVLESHGELALASDEMARCVCGPRGMSIAPVETRQLRAVYARSEFSEAIDVDQVVQHSDDVTVRLRRRDSNKDSTGVFVARERLHRFEFEPESRC